MDHVANGDLAIRRSCHNGTAGTSPSCNCSDCS